jgi:hypothetical protein
MILLIFHADKPFPDGIFCEFGDASHIQFLHHVPAMSLNGFYAHAKVSGYLF